MACRAPADQQHGPQHRGQHQSGAEVGLLVDEGERDGGQQQHHDQGPGRQPAPGRGAVAGQSDDEPDLDELGRLELVGADLEPGLGALALVADGEHREQHQQAKRRRSPPPSPAGGGSRRRRPANITTTPSTMKISLLLDEVDGREPGGLQLVAGGGVDHEATEAPMIKSVATISTKSRCRHMLGARPWRLAGGGVETISSGRRFLQPNR